MQQNIKEIVSSLTVSKRQLIITKRVKGLPIEFEIIENDRIRSFIVLNEFINFGLENKLQYLKWLQHQLKQKLKNN